MRICQDENGLRMDRDNFIFVFFFLITMHARITSSCRRFRFRIKTRVYFACTMFTVLGLVFVFLHVFSWLMWVLFSVRVQSFPKSSSPKWPVVYRLEMDIKSCSLLLFLITAVHFASPYFPSFVFPTVSLSVSPCIAFALNPARKSGGALWPPQQVPAKLWTAMCFVYLRCHFSRQRMYFSDYLFIRLFVRLFAHSSVCLYICLAYLFTWRNG